MNADLICFYLLPSSCFRLECFTCYSYTFLFKYLANIPGGRVGHAQWSSSIGIVISPTTVGFKSINKTFFEILSFSGLIYLSESILKLPNEDKLFGGGGAGKAGVKFPFLYIKHLPAVG